MEAYTSAAFSSSSSSMHCPSQQGKGLSQSFHSSLHSVRKPPFKPWKKPIAPLPPTPPKVYKVDPMNFRDLVQKLTGAAPEPDQPPQRRLQSVAPPPLDLDHKSEPNQHQHQRSLFSKDVSDEPSLQLLPSPAKTPLTALFHDLMSESAQFEPRPKRVSDNLELNLLSPSSHSWCAFPLLSPGTLSSLGQSTVL